LRRQRGRRINFPVSGKGKTAVTAHVAGQLSESPNQIERTFPFSYSSQEKKFQRAWVQAVRNGLWQIRGIG
jgi:hypothetical protein